MLLQVAGIRRYDGEYEFDPDRPFNALEWRWVKKFAGYFPLTIQDGIRVGDPDVYLVLAIIAMHRSGKLDPRDADDIFEEMSYKPFEETVIIADSDDESQDEPVPLATPPDDPSPSD